MRPALPGPQPEMSRQDADVPSVCFKNRVNRSASFPARHAEIQSVESPNGEARKQRVAVMSIRSKQCRPGNRGVAHSLRKLFQHVQCNFGLPLQLLQCDDVGVEFTENGLRAALIATPVAPDAAMHIVGDHHQARQRARPLVRRPRLYHGSNARGAPASAGLQMRRAR